MASGGSGGRVRLGCSGWEATALPAGAIRQRSGVWERPRGMRGQPAPPCGCRGDVHPPMMPLATPRATATSARRPTRPLGRPSRAGRVGSRGSRGPSARDVGSAFASGTPGVRSADERLGRRDRRECDRRLRGALAAPVDHGGLRTVGVHAGRSGDRPAGPGPVGPGAGSRGHADAAGERPGPDAVHGRGRDQGPGPAPGGVPAAAAARGGSAGHDGSGVARRLAPADRSERVGAGPGRHHPGADGRRAREAGRLRQAES